MPVWYRPEPDENGEAVEIFRGTVWEMAKALDAAKVEIDQWTEHYAACTTERSHFQTLLQRERRNVRLLHDATIILRRAIHTCDPTGMQNALQESNVLINNVSDATNHGPRPSCEVCDAGGIAAEDCPICGSKLLPWYMTEVELLRDELARLEERIFQVHPRVWKLVDKGREFIVIGEHKPYYLTAYAIIRDNEMKQGTWTERDRVAFAAAQLAAREEDEAERLPQRFRWKEHGHWRYGWCEPMVDGWLIRAGAGFGSFDDDPWEIMGHIIGDMEAFEWIDNDFGWHGDVMEERK